METLTHNKTEEDILIGKLTRVSKSYKTIKTRWSYTTSLIMTAREENPEYEVPHLESTEKFLLAIVSMRNKIKELRIKFDKPYMERQMKRHVRFERYEEAALLRDAIGNLNTQSEKVLQLICNIFVYDTKNK